MKSQFPQPGDRVSPVCGPGEFPGDKAGTVITTYSNQWYSNIALVLMDSGNTEQIIGAYKETGIGWYLVKRASEVQA